jgi:hypothetical protein
MHTAEVAHAHGDPDLEHHLGSGAWPVRRRGAGRDGLPATEGRALARLLPAALAAGLVVLPAVGAVLGYLEGTLKVH